MDYLLLLSGIIGFGPAFTVIWFSLRKYDWPYVKGSCFDDRKVFFILAIGMVLGTVLFTLERYTYPVFRWVNPVTGEIGFNPLYFFLVFVLGFAFIQTLGKFIILNFPGFQGRPDSQFLGISLGAGISATWIVGFSYVAFIVEAAEQNWLNWLALILLSINIALIHAAVGGVLGASGIRHEGLRGLPKALVPQLIFNLMMFPWFAMDIIWYTIAIATPISVLIYREIYLHTIPESLPDEIKKEIKDRERKERKRARRARKIN